jgi:hypothetical protein
MHDLIWGLILGAGLIIGGRILLVNTTRRVKRGIRKGKRYL